MKFEILNKYKILIITIIILAFSFYWYELRPMSITIKCSSGASETALENKGGGYQKQIAVYEFLYKECIRRNGL